MSLNINGTTITKVKFTNASYTNKDLTDIMYNGTHVWCLPPDFGLQHQAVVTAVNEEGTRYWAIKLEVTNNSTRSIKYTFDCPKLGIINTAHTLNAKETKTVSFSVGTTMPKPIAFTWTVTYLGTTASFVTSQKTS